jgi:hypothetical protein
MPEAGGKTVKVIFKKGIVGHFRSFQFGRSLLPLIQCAGQLQLVVAAHYAPSWERLGGALQPRGAVRQEFPCC